MVDITLVEGEPSVNEKGKESYAKMSTSGETKTIRNKGP